MRPIHVLSAAAVLLAAVRVDAQHTPNQPNQPPAQRPPATPGQPAPPAQPATPATASPANDDNAEKPKYDLAAVERGKQILVQQCGFCHGSNARGGQQGPDLTRSALVQSDENGRQLGEFLKVGRPEKAMPPFPHLAQGQDLEDLATFLHYTIESVANRGKYQILNILVGDPKKGQAFFEGAGRCVSCHSTTGDLKGVGGKYEDAVTLQQRIAMPRGRRRGRPQPGAAPEQPPFLQPTAVKATVNRSPDRSSASPTSTSRSTTQGRSRCGPGCARTECRR
jgi:mono/diheme cytochrome c family protein